MAAYLAAQLWESKQVMISIPKTLRNGSDCFFCASVSGSECGRTRVGAADEPITGRPEI